MKNIIHDLPKKFLEEDTFGWTPIVNRIADIISSQFKIDSQNTIDKRKLEEDRFGYMSMHYVVSFSNTRLKLAEFKPYKGLKFEIQIRSILQHGWAEIEHDLGYKGAKGIPAEFKRDFNRIAALLETADKEFDRLRTELESYDQEVEKDITSKQSELGIDNSTLKQFIEHNQNLKDINLAIANYYDVNLTENLSASQLGELSEKLKGYELKYIEDLENYIGREKEHLLSNLNSFLKSKKGEVVGVNSTVGIHVLIDVILSKIKVKHL